MYPDCLMRFKYRAPRWVSQTRLQALRRARSAMTKRSFLVQVLTILPSFPFSSLILCAAYRRDVG